MFGYPKWIKVWIHIMTCNTYKEDIEVGEKKGTKGDKSYT